MKKADDPKLEEIVESYSEHASEMNLGQLTNAILNLEALEGAGSPQEKKKIERLITSLEDKRSEEFEDHKFPFHQDSHLHKMLTESEPEEIARKLLENAHTRQESAHHFPMHENDILRNTPRELWATIAEVGREIEKQREGHATGEYTTRRLASQFVEAMNMLSNNVTDKQLSSVLNEISSNLVDEECKAIVHTVQSHSASDKTSSVSRNNVGLAKQHANNESLCR